MEQMYLKIQLSGTNKKKGKETVAYIINTFAVLQFSRIKLFSPNEQQWQLQMTNKPNNNNIQI